MKRFCLFLLSLMVVQFLFSQNSLDIFTLSGRYAFPSNYDSTYDGKAKESGSYMALTVPIPLSKKTIIYNSLNYFYFHIDNEPDMPDEIVDPIDLHGFIFRTGLIQRLQDGRSLQLLIVPRFMTDMKGGGIENFQFGGLAIYEKKYNSNLTMGYGAMYNHGFFGPYLVPLVNLNWTLTERFSITGMLPVFAKLNYKVSDRFTAGFSHFGLTTSYGLNDTDYAEDYLERQSIDLALFGNYKLYNNFYLEARFGQSISRCYKQYGSDDKVDFALPLITFGDNRTLKNVQFEDGPFIDLRLIYRIPIPQD